MMRFFRRHRNVFLYILTAIIAVPFIFFVPGVDLGGGSPRGETYGTILGEEVTVADLEAFHAQKAGRRRVLTPEEQDRAFQELGLVRFAEAQGLRLDLEGSRQDLKLQWKQMNIKDADAWDREFPDEIVYQYALERLQQGIVTLVQAGMWATDVECMRDFLRRHESRKVRYVAYKAADFQELVPAEAIAGDEVKSYYEERKRIPPSVGVVGFALPAKVSVEALFIDKEALRAETKVSDEEIQKYYEENKKEKYKKAPAAVPEADKAEAPEAPAPDAQKGEEPKAENPIDPAPSPADEYLPLEDVRAQIVGNLTEEKIQKRIDEIALEAKRLMGPMVSRPQEMPAVASRLKLAYAAETGPYTDEEWRTSKEFGPLQPALIREFFAASPSDPAESETRLERGGLVWRAKRKVEASSRPLEEVEGEIRQHLRLKKVQDKLWPRAEALQKTLETTSWDEAIRKENEELRKLTPSLGEDPLRTEETPFFKASDASLAGIGEFWLFRAEAFRLPKKKDPKDSKPGEEPPKTQVGLAADGKNHQIYILDLVETSRGDMRGFAAEQAGLRRRLTYAKQEQAQGWLQVLLETSVLKRKAQDESSEQ